MKKNRVADIGLALLMVTSLLGCGATNTATDAASSNAASVTAATTTTDTTTATSSSGEVVTLNMMGWQASPLETESVKNGLKIFEEQHPNIKVNYTNSLSGTEYTAKLLSSAASDSMPDVFFCQSADYRTFVSKGVLMDITNKFGDEFSLDDFIDSSKKIMEVNGKEYGVSSCTVEPIIYYNKDVFDAAGVPYPEADPSKAWTIAEFREVAKKLTTKDIYGCYGFESNGMWNALVQENGGNYYNDDLTASKFNSAENKEVFEQLKAIRTEDHSAPDAATLESVGMSAAQMLETGKIAMLCDGSWSLQELAASGMNIGMAPLPSFKNATSAGQAHLHCISANTKHPDEAWELIKFLSSMDYQSALIKSGLWMPNRHSLYTEEGMKSWYDEKVHGDSYLKMLSYFEDAKADEVALCTSNKATDAITEEMNTYFQQDADLDTVMTEADSRINEALTEAAAQ